MLLGASLAESKRRIPEIEDFTELGNFLALLQFGTLPHDATMRNIERFAKDVIPQLRSPLAPAAIGAAR